MKLYEKQDNQGWKRSSRLWKWYRQKKHRIERRRAKANPECHPLYTKYRGWVLLIPVCLLVSCASRYVGPDPGLFPDQSKEYNAGYDKGFKKGFMEGLIYNTLSQ